MAARSNTRNRPRAASSPVSPLTAADRCDACGAPGLARAKQESGGATLVFCRHHAEGSREKLTQQGFALETFYQSLYSDDDR